MPKVEDPHIEDLIAIIEGFTIQLSARMVELAISQQSAVRAAMQAEVRGILQNMRQAIQNWLTSVFGELVAGIDEDLLADIPEELLETDELGPIQDVSNVIKRFQQDTETAISAMEAMTARLTRGDPTPVVQEDKNRLVAALAAGAAGATVVASIRARATERLRTQLLQLLGGNGRIYRYDLSYYIALAAHIFKGKLQHRIALTRAHQLGLDLVQVSPNPSTIGDYCDLYRGKVFSISGTHSLFHPLALAPNGGTPFHPWCHHWLIPFDETKVDASVQKKLAEIPKAFLDLGKAGGSPNDFQALWRKHSGLRGNRNRSGRGKK